MNWLRAAFKRFTLIFLVLIITPILQANSLPLNVYTYSSFASKWGPGPQVKTLFEQQYPRCTVNFVVFEDGITMFNRMRLEGEKTKADIVLGIDNHLLSEAEKSAIFGKNSVDLSKLSLPVKWDNQTFLPYDFGEYAFIYDKTKLVNPPKSLKELVERQDIRVIYQDPRTSTVGRGLLIWMNTVYAMNEIEKAWKKLASHTVTVGKGWSETYGAFLKGEADVVLSYNTSPLYHILNDKSDKYQALVFNEGGVQQIELSAKVAHSNSAPCADQFLDFLLTDEAQRIIARHNIMLPVIDVKVEPHFDTLREAQLKTKPLDVPINMSELSKQWIAVWQNALTQ